MNLPTLIQDLIDNTLVVSLPRFGPELVLSVAIVALLLARVIPLLNRIPPFPLALVGAIAALIAAVPDGGLQASAWSEIERQELFSGMLVYDSVTVFMRLFLMAFLVLFVILSRLTGIADRDDGQDFFALVFGSTIGMCLMASSNHLLAVFLGVEMASVPSYVLAGIVKGRQRSSEAALKYAIYGAGAAGIMLYGTSLLAGVLGAAHLPTMTQRLIEFDLPTRVSAGDWSVLVLALGGMMLGVGLAFKLSAVPFHFWCPDVFEGATAEVGAFLSVASKAAALALLVRVGLGFGYSPTESAAVNSAQEPRLSATAPGNAPARPMHLVAAQVDVGEAAPADQADATVEPAAVQTPLEPVRRYFVMLTAIVAIVTCTFGNLAAYGQKNIKRMLAYSTIAHAGFMMMPVAAAVSMSARDPAGARDAVAAMLFYATVYLFMNLGAFAIIAFLRNTMRSEEIKDYAGLIGRSPLAAISLTLILVSLIGLPPMAGFWPKLRVLMSLYEAGGPLLVFVMVAAAINSAIALVYYLRLAKTMCIDPQPDTSLPVEFGFLPAVYVLAVTAPLVIYGFLPKFDRPLGGPRHPGPLVMMTIDAIRQLNRLLAIHCRSFVQYLRWSKPYVPTDHEDELDTLAAIAADQDALAERVSKLVVDSGALPRTGEFPMEFTDLHDLDLDFLIAAAVRYQEHDLTAVQQVVDALAAAPAARAIAEEALGMSKGHLDSLRELLHIPVVTL